MEIISPERERIQGLHECCVTCGKIIEVLSPAWFYVSYDVRNGRVEWQYNPDETCLCIKCALAATDEATRPERVADLNAMLARKFAIGVPDDVTLFRLRSQNHDPSPMFRRVFRFDEYVVQYQGVLPANLPVKNLVATPDGLDEEPLSLLYLGFDFWEVDAPVLAGFTWNWRDLNQQTSLVLDGFDGVRPSDLAQFVRAASEFYERQLRGRPPGTTLYTLDDYVQAFTNATAKLGHPPNSLQEFTNATDLSADTLKRNFKRWNVKWSTFRREQGAA